MTYTVEQHIALKRVGAIAASPSGTWLAVSVDRLDRDGAKYVSDLWKLPTDGGPAVQLTRGDTKDKAPCFRHDGALGFLSNRQPNEVKPDDEAEKRMQVWLLPAEGGEPRQLTDEPLGVESFRFARRAGRLAYFAPVLAGVEHDKQRETAAERAKHGPSARRFSAQPVRHWDAWLHENEDLPCTHVIACDAAGGKRVDLTPQARREFAIEPALDVSDDGRRVAVERLSAAAAGGAHDHPTVLADGRIAVVRSTLLDAPECYVLENSKLVPLARLSGFAEAAGWAKVESFTTPSTDGTPIQCFLVTPKSAPAPLPLAYWVHGGPIGMHGDGWHWRWNQLLLVAAGYAVALPNPRGSTGFGQEFIQGIWGNVWGEQCYRDLMAVADALEAREDIDAGRTMAMGGSFGGYMTNWIARQLSEKGITRPARSARTLATARAVSSSRRRRSKA